MSRVTIHLDTNTQGATRLTTEGLPNNLTDQLIVDKPRLRHWLASLATATDPHGGPTAMTLLAQLQTATATNRRGKRA